MTPPGNGLATAEFKLEQMHADIRAQGSSMAAMTAELSRLVELQNRLITVIERKESPRALQYVILALFALIGGLLFGSDALTKAIAAVR